MASDELRSLVEQAVGKALPKRHLVVVFLLLPAIISLGGGFLGAYLGERGRGRAADDRFTIVLEQLQHTTKLTEDIKTHISSEAWLQQSRWNLRRDLYTRLLESLTEIVDATDSYFY